MGPVNWSPRFDAVPLDMKGAREFMRYAELNPLRAGLVKRAERWEWSSAAAHFAGSDDEGLLCLEQWLNFFGNPATAAADWRTYVEGPGEEEVANRVRLAALRLRMAPHNRPRGGYRMGSRSGWRRRPLRVCGPGVSCLWPA